MTASAAAALFDLTFIDVSQFAAEPLRTGVQRVLIKVIEHMPREWIMPFRVIDESHVAVIDPAIFDLGIRYFHRRTASRRDLVARAHGGSAPGEDELLIRLVASHPIAILPAEMFFARAARIINLEAFSDVSRARFYASCPAAYRGKVFHFIHDFLLFDAPETFPQLNWRYASDYILLFEAWCAAGGFFVASPAMACKVAQYFNRPPGDVQVVHFGGDMTPAPPAPRSRVAGERRSVVVLGTIEPRKYPSVVIESLLRLSAYHPDVVCTLIGKWGWVDVATKAAIERLLEAGRITHFTELADDDAARIMRNADVGIYVSSNEGFGLPVIEFAAMGVPVVTNAAVPSALLLGQDCATVLQHVDVQALVTAVEMRLAGEPPRKPCYKWTWADCAHEIFSRGTGRPAFREGTTHGAAIWQFCGHLMRDLRPGPLTAKSIKSELRRRLSACAATFTRRQMASIAELISEIVTDNRDLIYWADVAQTRALLADIVRALVADTKLGGLDHAFTALLGRPIDTPAASEALGMVTHEAVWQRIVRLIESEEARGYLGSQLARSLRHVAMALGDLVTTCFGEPIDLVSLADRLGVPQPTVARVFLVDQMLRCGVDRIELLLYLAQDRPLSGDVLDLFLEAASGVCLERGLIPICIEFDSSKNGKRQEEAVLF